MRTKLFLSFILIILLALLSNTVFERLIRNDFKEYIQSTQEDKVYWVLATVEGSYRNKRWEMPLLKEALHWSIMLGFEAYVVDPSGKKLLSSTDTLSMLNTTMLKRMSALFELPTGVGEFTWYPLFVEGNEIGKLYIRPLKRLGFVPRKESIFLRRGREFLLISFLIAGAGALLLSVLFTIFLSMPIRRLTKAAEKIAAGDFTVKIKRQHKPLYGLLRTEDEIDRLTRAFNYMAEALKREDALRKHLTSNIAHELRTPLTIIKGNLEAIEDGVISDAQSVLKNINSEIERIISLIEGIDDITQAEASFFKKGKKERIRLAELIRSIVDGMRQLIEEKGLSIEISGPDITVETYPEKLHIILKNLITNACKFTERGGIEISWQGEPTNDPGTFSISVRDSGRGIQRKDLHRIFDRFYKDRESPGRGLGLAIVKELTETMDGTIQVRSRPQKGTEFLIQFEETEG
ncbi:signal transduction histidine-protein kinase BaeS [bacterium BMS3Bbin06]|nr:signal transduction histidine-protein kinase BaeS [bacterium BMS3Abin08]GBE34579.1 signal transduction histidine-protein kinase BaeS [bacterium BMS3Bbin06]HDO36158.1 HAMP domain-containing histidine kinase [Nitrospirota bacterium]HDY71921.1 HAMP domain-containing histidine kinase [Nitrospirota bacterium]